ncbi:MAG: D-2-hydroxyacid dehydrogenase [Acidobacteria bacterium]|nr:MAG: D-2-hydroxyacid dehydrogenase [Acidobacteriota bacterium]
MKVVTSVASESVWILPDTLVDALRARFPDVQFVNVPRREDRPREFRHADVLFLSQLRPDEFAAAPAVRWIQSPAAGVGSLLFPELRESEVVLTNARGIHGQPMAEHVIGLTIVLFRQIHRAIRRQARHEWGKDDLASFRALAGATIGVVGLGAIGCAVAEKACALGMEVVALRRTPGARPSGVSKVYTVSELDSFLAEPDVVVLTAPLTVETRGLIGAEQLRRMKPTAILINVARGKLLREAEVAEELAKGTIAGAGLDVFEHEPLDPASPLWDLPNVVLTPHTSAFRRDYWDAAVALFADNLERFLRGSPLLNVVDKQAGY